ncbi:hypothetical protein [Serratia liquefaciens]|uniref:hypothetical protein n=1 Tax=Serratia liquefaciens TaxID=614 RepID=UPI0022B9A70E|nr:hypothetical protein [Serratia liquefaciens]
MAFIRVVNNWGDTLIDDNFMNVRLVSKGGLSMTRDVDEGDYQDIHYNATNPEFPPLLAIRCSSHRTTLIRTIRNGNNYTFRIGYMIGLDSSNPENVTGQFYIFDSAPKTDSRLGNLCLRNAAGQVVFDSGYDYMNVVDMVYLPEFNNGSQPQTNISYPSDKTYAAVTISQGYFWMFSSAYDDVGKYWETDITYMFSGVVFSGNTAFFQGGVFTSQYFQSQSSQGQGNSQSGRGIYMIIDVTGL